MKERPVLESIIAEIHRRAEKEWAGDGYDFEVTITADEYKALCEEEAAIISRDNWISVDERMPEEDIEVVGACEHGMPWIVSHHNGFFTDYDHELVAITHWMPIPNLPQQEESKP